MKKFSICLSIAFLMFTFVPSSVSASNEPIAASVPAPTPAETAQATTLLSRLDEIKAMDMSTLSSTEKRQLRKETRSIKKDLRRISGGVYLSTGAIIIIILILILVL